MAPNLVRVVRRSRGWSISELSRRTCINRADLSLLERGQRPAFPGWRKRIARAFRVSIVDLFPAEPRT